MRTGLTLVLLLGLPAGFLGWREWCVRESASNERSMDPALRLLMAVEGDIRQGDLDGNGIQDFWTADVAGLGSFSGRIRNQFYDVGWLSEIAAADPTRPGARPFKGYWFVAMKDDDQGMTYGAKRKDRFAFCAYPARYGVTGRFTFIVSEERTPTRRDLQGAPVLKWPPESEQTLWPRCISG